MTRANRYDGWSVEGREGQHIQRVGMTSDHDGESGPVYHDTRAGEVFRTEPDQETERLVPIPDSVRSTDESSVASVIRDIGDELGWESLSEFGKEQSENSDENGGS